MPAKPEKIDEKESLRLEKLRKKGEQEIDDCIQLKIENLPILDQIATLSNTGRLHLFYKAIGEARLEKHSWLAIANAAKGINTYQDAQYFSFNYRSYCKNNNIQPVKIRGNKK